MLTDREIKLVVGSLLHDIGKVVYRGGDGRNHSTSGYEFLKDQAKIEDTEILNCVKYHHGKDINNAEIAVDDIAYITYYADNVAAFTDRREAAVQEEGFDKSIPLDSVFNILNGNHGKCHYAMLVLNPKEEINYPTEEMVSMDKHFYKTVVDNIMNNLLGIELKEEYVNSLLSVLEANLSYIPSSTSKRELADISLFDHVKITAAVASCVEQYLKEQNETNYREILFQNTKTTYEKEMFLLYSMDISGIQKFIYSISDKGALKGLRARSFYLEIMMEHVIDELLEKLSLSRANLIYTGGGHCYMLLPNTKEVLQTLDSYEKQVNQWLLETFDISLYIACGYAVASANNLRNVPEGSYSELYQEISKMLSEKKAHRYGADVIQYLNKKKRDGERECSVCRRVAKVSGTEKRCPICEALEHMGRDMLHGDYFVILCEPQEYALPLPGNRYLAVVSENHIKETMQKESYVRCYTKNNFYTGKLVTTKLWVGDYVAKDATTFEELAEKSKGIKKIAVLRADVDNLGTSFVYGFKRGEDERYVTLSRTAALSRQLSLFFKGYINKILTQGNESVFAESGPRNVVIVYSGGDDVFLAGAWNEVIAAFMDLRKALEKFTQGTLTISGGIGVYADSYPIHVMAQETQFLEDCSKECEGKNAITIWNEDHSYPWSGFIKNVVDEKFRVLQEYFEKNNERGMAFLYHLTELLRAYSEQINIARYVYLLSRMEPDRDSLPAVQDAYQKFSEKMYLWSQNLKDRRELLTAIYLYVYLNRKEEDA
jgi:CRISPR-associated protein, csm1 family